MKYLIRFSLLLLATIVVGFFVPANAHAADAGEIVNFNVESAFDVAARSHLDAVLVKSSASLYFYIEKNWWEGQLPIKQQEILADLESLSQEFSGKIYPTLTSVFGNEWKTGVDGDVKITLLFHSMKDGAAGYFRSADEYIKLQVPSSNEREMLYLSLANIESPSLKVFLAHEFVHLITFNQKDRLQGTQEDVWLNEARADYASTILGYDNVFEGSNLQKRVRDFLASPSDPLTEWKDSKYDYAVANIFMHYLVDHYSLAVLTDSLKSKSVGIASINEVLSKKGAKEQFAQIFTNWTIATLVNDCSQNTKYCYLTPALKNLRINPTLNFLPLSGNSSLSVNNVTKNWAGNWQKIIGGNGDLHVTFESLVGLQFSLPYIIFDKNNNYSVKFLTLDATKKGSLDIPEFATNYNSLILLPSLQTKMSGFESLELTYPYTFTASITEPPTQEEQIIIRELLATIESLKQQIAALQGQQPANSCAFLVNLYVGINNTPEVSCLQVFLKSQGQEIYSQGLVTGYFGSLTKAAVVRLQKKYDILATGFVGPLTRAKINTLLNGG